MRVAMRKRYYCDHCKKSGGSSYHMVNHENGCTMNPARKCGVCDAAACDSQSLDELKAYVASVRDHEGCLEPANVATLRDMAGGCPACMLAALRQTKTFASRNSDDTESFNFKEEMKSVWDNVNDERRAACGY